MMTLLTALPSRQASVTARMSLQHVVVVAALEAPDVDDHVDFLGAVADGLAGLHALDVRGVGPQGKADHRAGQHAAAAQAVGHDA